MGNYNQYPEILLRGKSDKEKQQTVAELENSAILVEISKILKTWKAEALATKESDYTSPSWGYLQADRNGTIRALDKVLKLIQPTP